MKVIDFRFRPNTPETVAGVLNNKVFGEMGKMFRVAEYLKGESLEQIIENMDAHNVVHGVVTGRDAARERVRRPTPVCWSGKKSV